MIFGAGTKDFRALSQLVIVEPGKRYALRGFYRSELDTRALFKWEASDGSTVLAATGPLANRTAWQPFELQFTAPADADGITATAILLLCLRLLGARADYYIPNRIDEGYGLNHEAMRTLAGAGAEVVITVDCGIASIAEAETARDLGLTLIITDHHRPSVGDSLRE